jgi:hypothetical protein
VAADAMTLNRCNEKPDQNWHCYFDPAYIVPNPQESLMLFPIC